MFNLKRQARGAGALLRKMQTWWMVDKCGWTNGQIQKWTNVDGG